jgi:predicted phosphodiesterase
MRVALISDIHGNLVSLEAVLEDIDREEVDQIVCLGDVAVLGPQPLEVLARLRAFDCACVMGNHDLDLLDPAQTNEVEPWVTEVTAWCVDQVSASDLDYVRSFRPLIEIPLGDQMTLLCYHGSPRSSADRILSTTPAEEVEGMLAGHRATVMAGGHNHVQMVRQHKDMWVVNVGSVGQSLEQMPFEGVPRLLPWAGYAIVNRARDVLSVELRRVSIDLDRVKQAAWASDMPGAGDWVSWWITPPGH